MAICAVYTPGYRSACVLTGVGALNYFSANPQRKALHKAMDRE